MRGVLVDIVITTKDNRQLLSLLLDSIYHQDFSDYICWVVDDNSTDGTKDMVRQQYPWVRLLVAPKRRGPSLNRDLTIRKGKAEFIVTLDDDIVLEPNWLSKMLECIRFSQRIGVVGSHLRSMSSAQKVVSAGGFFGEGGFGGDLFLNRTLEEFKQSFSNFYYRVVFACSAAMIMRRKAYEKAGGFDRSYFYLAEDYDLSLRMNLIGYLVLANSDAVAYHGYQQTVKRFPPGYFSYLRYRNHLRTILKDFGLDGLSQMLLRFSLEMGRDIYSSLLKRKFQDSWIITKSVIWNFFHLLGVLKQRRYIQSRGKINDSEIFAVNSRLLSLSGSPPLRSLAFKSLSTKEKIGAIFLKALFRLATRKRKVKSRYVDYLIFWVTNLCDAHCPMCFLKDKLNKDTQNNLSLGEFERIFNSLGRVKDNIILGGGEPFLRRDIDEICISADRICRPSLLTIPTNGNNPKIIFSKVKSILESIDAHLLLSLSLDGLPKTHERIRGVDGIFARLQETYEGLITLREIFYPRLELQINTTLFKDNYEEFPQLYEFLKDRFADVQFSFEPIRGHYNPDLAESITQEQYRRFLDYLNSHCDPRIDWQIPIHELTLQILRRQTQVIPCVAGSNFIVIDFSGNIYPCEMLPAFLNLRNIGYDIKRVFRDKRWAKVIQEIQSGRCHCAHMCFLSASLKKQILKDNLSQR
jgi:radical SAM protein with 4Fe4S-binding SPASM domain